MTYKLRFAPSPTGLLHVGNIRAGMMNWLLAKSNGGQFLLRFDDTDQQRSKESYARQILEDLDWLGIIPDQVLKQSDRFSRYEEVMRMLIDKGLVYACYETPEELQRRRRRALARGRPPVYDRAALNLTADEIDQLEKDGRKPHFRFKLSHTTITFEDLIRGQVSTPLSTLSDPVIRREDGSWLYVLTSVIDDIDTHISHVVRGEDHVTNTAVQVDMFNALGATSPIFAHHSMLVDATGSGLSKRLGSLSIKSMRQDGIEPLALSSYIAHLGTSDAITLANNMDELVSRFDIGKFSRAPAHFNPEDVKAMSARLLHGSDYEEVKGRLERRGIECDEKTWLALRANISKLEDVRKWKEIVSQMPDIHLSNEMRNVIQVALETLPETFEVDEERAQAWNEWNKSIREKSGARGKSLFMPLRLALTGLDHGPDMIHLLSLFTREQIVKRLTHAL